MHRAYFTWCPRASRWPRPEVPQSTMELFYGTSRAPWWPNPKHHGFCQGAAWGPGSPAQKPMDLFMAPHAVSGGRFDASCLPDPFKLASTCLSFLQWASILLFVSNSCLRNSPYSLPSPPPCNILNFNWLPPALAPHHGVWRFGSPWQPHSPPISPSFLFSI